MDRSLALMVIGVCKPSARAAAPVGAPSTRGTSLAPHVGCDRPSHAGCEDRQTERHPEQRQRERNGRDEHRREALGAHQPAHAREEPRLRGFGNRECRGARRAQAVAGVHRAEGDGEEPGAERHRAQLAEHQEEIQPRRHEREVDEPRDRDEDAAHQQLHGGRDVRADLDPRDVGRRCAQRRRGEPGREEKRGAGCEAEAHDPESLERSDGGAIRPASSGASRRRDCAPPCPR